MQVNLWKLYALNLLKRQTKCLLSDAPFVAEKSPEIVCLPGFAQIRWGSLQRSLDHPARLRDLILKRGEGAEGRCWKGRSGEIMERRTVKEEGRKWGIGGDGWKGRREEIAYLQMAFNPVFRHAKIIKIHQDVPELSA